MQTKQPIEVELVEKTGVLRFIRPEIKNPLSVRTLEILDAEFEKLIRDKAIEKIIFTGSGNTFAAGANLIEVSQLNENTAVDFGLRGQRLMQKIYNSEKDRCGIWCSLVLSHRCILLYLHYSNR